MKYERFTVTGQGENKERQSHRGAKLTFSQSEEDERLYGGSDADGGGGGRPGGAQPRGQHVGAGRQKAERTGLAGDAALGGDDEDLLLDRSADDGRVGGGHGHRGQDEDGLRKVGWVIQFCK